MAKPSSTFTWATDANFSTGPRSGQPTTVTPLAGELAQGFIPGSAFPSEWANYILKIAGEWVVWANTYAAGLELDNVFAGFNTFNGLVLINGATTIDENLEVMSPYQLTVSGTGRFKGEIVMDSTAYIDSAMTTGSVSRVEGAWKISDASSPYVSGSGTSGITQYSVNTTASIANAATDTIATISLPDDSIFCMTFTAATWVDGSAATPASSHFHVSGRTTAGGISYNSDELNAHVGGNLLPISVGVSSLNFLIQCTNNTGSLQTVNSMVSYSIQVADQTQ